MSETWNATFEADDDEPGEKGDGDTYAFAILDCEDEDVIDLTGINLEDEESWLFQPTSNRASLDLQAWLHADLDPSSAPTTATTAATAAKTETGSPIDTRTFTRSKKKFPKLSIDAIRERALPAFPSTDSECSPLPWTKMKINWKEEEARPEDGIPAMLRQSLSALPGEPAQESLEAFLNMSQSKGIDSFINLAEPEFNESLMNISRPSFLQTTISNQTLNCTATVNASLADSQILTESMMQTSMFNDDISTENLSDDGSLNSTATLNKSFLSDNNGDDTFINLPESATTNVSNNEPSNHESFIVNTTCNLSESFTVNKTFDRLSSTSGNLSETITLVDSSKCSRRSAADNSNETFVSNGSFLNRIPVNSTFSHEIDEDDELPKKDATQHDLSSLNSTYVTTNSTEEKKIAGSEEPSESLDMTYSKRGGTKDLSPDIIKMAGSAASKDEMYKAQSEERLGEKLPEPPANRYQTYRKPTANKNDRMVQPMLKKIHQGKSMESLHKMSTIGTLDRDYAPKSLSRLPQTLQKSNPNLGSSHSNLASSHSNLASSHSNLGPAVNNRAKRMVQPKFGFQYGKIGVKNGPPAYNRLNNLNRVQGADKETRNSSESIESTLSTYSGPDFDDGLSTCSDGSRHSEQVYKIVKVQEEKSNKGSTPKPDRKILENTWMTGEQDLPSPILKNNSVVGAQIVSSNNLEGEIKTSSPIISPAESLQSLPTSNSEAVVSEQGKVEKKSLPVNRITSVFKAPQNLETKTETVRVPANRPSNLPSGIPRPASRIPAPRFFRATAPVKTQSALKKGLF